MLNIHYPDSDLQIIQHDRYHHEHPAIRKRMTILALHSQGIVGEQLCQLAAAAHNTVYALLRYYRDGGLKN
ncbi:MAG: hypothetical protein LBT46_03585, partial [Planctomycetaceae bacterium]|nr:hypothetical protein [Planctomycetaceae bacterium]